MAKFAKCNVAEWYEKHHYASDMLFECPHGNVVLSSNIGRAFS